MSLISFLFLQAKSITIWYCWAVVRALFLTYDLKLLQLFSVSLRRSVAAVVSHRSQYTWTLLVSRPSMKPTLCC